MSDTPYLKIKEVKAEISDLSALTPGERTEFESLKNPKRKAEWLSARLAAKELIRESLGADVEISILSDADRKPFARAGGKEFYISLSHRDGLCACALNPKLTPLIGVDVEKIEKRAEAWEKDYFTPAEAGACGGSEEKFTELWTLKEAALKMLGLGLSVDAKEAEITGGRIKFYGKALARYKELREPSISWKSFRKDDYIVSVVWA